MVRINLPPEEAAQLRKQFQERLVLLSEMRRKRRQELIEDEMSELKEPLMTFLMILKLLKIKLKIRRKYEYTKNF